MTASQRPQLTRLLSEQVSREIALTQVAKLVRLLPGSKLPSTQVDWSVEPEAVPTNLSNLDTARLTSLNSAFLKKFKGFTFGDPRKVAKEAFLKYEEHCRISNRRFRLMRERVTDPFLNDILFVAQRKIAQVLGRFDLDELLSTSRWGPGSTSSCKGPLVGASKKFEARPDVTGAFLCNARLAMPLLPSWSALLAGEDYGVIVNPIMPIVKGNKITFVPKTAKTHRTIAVEPHINVFFQNGLGRMIRRRLKQRARVDLDDQTLNQRLARLGSIDNSLATIDLEGASDTICIELVRDLLPEDWFSWLDSARSHFGELDGEVIRYHKFSSMGNGATFDLESLIFWSLSSAVVEHLGYNSFWVNVFGDDIVVPSGAYGEVVRVLESCGFIVNKTKSFSSGPFRESCGKDWFLGDDVRPIYLKDIPTRPIDWIILANQIRLLAHRWAGGRSCDARFKPAWDFCIKQIPPVLRRRVPAGAYVPEGYESLGIVSNIDEAEPPSYKKCGGGHEGYIVTTFAARAVKIHYSERSLLVAGCFRPSSFGQNFLVLRDRVAFRDRKSVV